MEKHLLRIMMVGMLLCTGMANANTDAPNEDSLNINHSNAATKNYKLCLQDSDCYYADSYIKISVNKKEGYDFLKSKKDSLVLWISGICYPNMKPLCFNDKDSAFIFRMYYDTSAASGWRLLYAWPAYQKFRHTLDISIGTKKRHFNNLEAAKIVIFTSSRLMFYTGYTLFILLLIFIFYYCKGALKDTSLLALNGAIITDEIISRDLAISQGKIMRKDIPVSLARFQFLFWLLIIFYGIIHIWAITDTLAQPSGTVLLLLGISGGTLFIGRFIDNEAPAAATPALTPAQVAEKFYNSGLLSRNFLMDIMNDGKGISLHRLQLFIFTVFLGMVFTWQMLYSLALPQFSESMLALMGISSTTYAGIKTLEKTI